MISDYHTIVIVAKRIHDNDTTVVHFACVMRERNVNNLGGAGLCS